MGRWDGMAEKIGAKHGICGQRTWDLWGNRDGDELNEPREMVI